MLDHSQLLAPLWVNAVTDFSTIFGRKNPAVIVRWNSSYVVTWSSRETMCFTDS